MNKFEASIDLTIYADAEYKYMVHSGDAISIAYVERSTTRKVELSFGSMEEMEAVAIAMLKVVKMTKE